MSTTVDSPTLTLVFGKGSSAALSFEDHLSALLAGTPASFWPIALPWAKEAHAATGVDISVILSQWAIESAYGGVDWQPPRNNPGNVGDYNAGGQMDFPSLAAGVAGYIQTMELGYYVGVRSAVGWYNQSLALGQSPWAGARYALPGSYPGSELIWVINAYNLTQYDAGGPTPAPQPTPPAPILFRKPLTGIYGKLNAPAVAVCPTPSNQGYAIVAADGGTFNYGDATFLGSLGGTKLNAPIINAVRTPSGNGLTLVGTDGGIFCFGDAQFYGSMGGKALNAPVVSIAGKPGGGGYWLVAADGGVFNYGAAGFYGSAGSLKLNAPVVGIAATPSGHGYWLAAADGGVFCYGDATFDGSMGGTTLNAPIVDIAACPTGGYWLIGTDGGVFAFGGAPFHGSTGAIHLAAPITDFASSSDGGGYWFVGADGGIFNYGDAAFKGSPA